MNRSVIAIQSAVGVRGDVRVVVADGAVELAVDRDGSEELRLPLQAIDEVRDLLAERRRRCGLAVRAREHRHGSETVGELAQIDGQLAHRGQQHALPGVPQHQRIGEVVDVLGRAREVNERLEVAGLNGDALELLPQVILDGLDVMVRFRLERLDACRRRRR